MRQAARDGNGYEYATTVPARVYVATVNLLPLLPPDSDTEEGAPEDADAVVEAVDAVTSEPAPSNGNRGAWLQEDDGKSSLFLPGMEPDDEDKKSGDTSDDTSDDT
jgi:hypothetical protein